MSNDEQQEEEREVLLSIYDGDSNFFDNGPKLYQYKIGEDGAAKSALIEISWGENYPEELPSINLDVFYNKHIFPEVKESLKEKLLEEAEALLGCGSTYTLFEYAKENLETLLEQQTDNPHVAAKQAALEEESQNPSPTSEPQERVITQRKEVLTKNQKRRMYDKFGTEGMQEGKQRGWNWVDVLKHLSQTGSKSDGQ